MFAALSVTRLLSIKIFIRATIDEHINTSNPVLHDWQSSLYEHQVLQIDCKCSLSPLNG
jgi:hypothetical protein